MTIVISEDCFLELPDEVQAEIIHFLNAGNNFSSNLDTYLAIGSEESKDPLAYWSGFWSFDRDNNLKGYVSISGGLTSVQLRINS